MGWKMRLGFSATAGLAVLTLCSGMAFAQKSGGILKLALLDTPPSGSLHEEATIATIAPFMPVFNNLSLFDQHVPQNSTASIVPELATEWSWSDDGKRPPFDLDRMGGVLGQRVYV